MELANDPSIDAIWFARGGYGANRMAEAALSRLNSVASDKKYLGYSDGGFLLAGLYARGVGQVAHGPMPSDLKRAGGEAAVLRGLHWLVTGQADEPQVAPPNSVNIAPPLTGTEPKRAAFEMSLFPLVNIDIPRGVFAVGAGFELGARFRLPYGALALALRPQYEYYAPAPGASHVVAVGLPITYRFRSLNADFAPYIGVLPQFAAEYSFLARDGVAIEDGTWRTQFGLGGLLGGELRLRRGSVFVEGGYRHMLNRDQRDDFASLNGVFVNLGYRVSF